MPITLWNFSSTNHALEAMEDVFPIPRELKLRWYIGYIVGAVLALIGLITVLFMLGVI
jgi:hypothetical protein